MNHQAANNAISTLAAGITNVAVSLTVATGDGAKFPALSGSQYFYATLATPPTGTETTREIVKVTARAGDVLTIVRAQQGTAASAFSLGDKVEERLTKSWADLILDTESVQTVAAGAAKSFTDGTAVQLGAELFTRLSTAPASPSASQIGVYSRLVSANDLVPMFGFDDGLGASSRDPFRAIWPDPASDEFSIARPNPGSNLGFNVAGSINWIQAVTAGFATKAAGSLRSESFRATNLQVAGANGKCGWAADTTGGRLIWRGSTAGRGGFRIEVVFGIEAGTTNQRLFVGLTSNSTIWNMVTGGDPSAPAFDFIAVACDQADANMAIFTKDGTTNTKTAFNTSTRTKAAMIGQLYRLVMDCGPNGSTIFVFLEELSASGYGRTTLHDGVMSTTIPRNTVFLRPEVIAGSGSSATDTQQISMGRFDAVWPVAA